MSNYFIGDIHGCYISLKRLLYRISFNPERDTLWITGDLVAKGPNSLEVLKLIYSLKNHVKIVLGNHDLNLLKIYSNSQYQYNKYKDTNNNLNMLHSQNANKLITWLRYQPIMQIDEKKKLIMTHAGINPKWNLNQAKQSAQEIENMLQSTNYASFLHNINNKNPTNIEKINISIQDFIRIQVNINTFTRMRYLFPNGQLELEYKDIPEKAPDSLIPWFNLPGLITSHYNIIFGHWSSLEGRGTPAGIYGLDSGCYRGGKLTSLHWENKRLIQIACNHNYL